MVEKTDRLYRNLKDYIVAEDLEIEIHFVKEGVVLSPESHSSEKLMHLIKVGMAKAYVENLGEEIKKGMHEKAAQGIWPCKAPVGYQNVTLASGKKGIEPDPETAPIVTKLYEWYSTGNYSLVEIAELATENGLNVRAKSKSGGHGTQSIQKPDLLRGLPLHREDSSRHSHSIGHQGTVGSRPGSSQEPWSCKAEAGKKHSFAFSNLIKCRHCGCALVAELKKQKYTYYPLHWLQGKMRRALRQRGSS